jgi:hypothetical protein
VPVTEKSFSIVVVVVFVCGLSCLDHWLVVTSPLPLHSAIAHRILRVLL